MTCVELALTSGTEPFPKTVCHQDMLQFSIAAARHFEAVRMCNKIEPRTLRLRGHLPSKSDRPQTNAQNRQPWDGGGSLSQTNCDSTTDLVQDSFSIELRLVGIERAGPGSCFLSSRLFGRPLGRHDRISRPIFDQRECNGF
jgi:hypothetical protein